MKRLYKYAGDKSLDGFENCQALPIIIFDVPL